MRFLENPASFSRFTIKELMIRKEIQPLVDVFSVKHSIVKDMINSLALHLLLLDDSS